MAGDPLIHARLRPSALHLPSEHHEPVFRRYPEFAHLLEEGGPRPEVEDRLEERAHRAQTDDVRTRALAEQERERTHDDRLPGPRLPRKDIQARAKVEREILDDGEVPDPELDQHGRLISPVEHSPQPAEKGLSPEADELDALLSLLDHEPISGGQRVRLLSVGAHR